MNQASTENLLAIYKDLFTYKHLLKGSPELTVDLSGVTAENLSTYLPVIQQQTQSVINYLLGVRETLNISAMLERINKHY